MIIRWFIIIILSLCLVLWKGIKVLHCCISLQHHSCCFCLSISPDFIYIYIALTILCFIVVANASIKIYYPCCVSHHIFIYSFNMLILLCLIDPSQCAFNLASKSKCSTSLVNSWVTYICHGFDWNLWFRTRYYLCEICMFLLFVSL